MPFDPQRVNHTEISIRFKRILAGKKGVARSLSPRIAASQVHLSRQSTPSTTLGPKSLEIELVSFVFDGKEGGAMRIYSIHCSVCEDAPPRLRQAL
jgi:hypothetical protein